MHLSFLWGKKKCKKDLGSSSSFFKANVHAMISILTLLFLELDFFLSPCNKDVKKTGLVSSRDLTWSKLCKTAQPLPRKPFFYSGKKQIGKI